MGGEGGLPCAILYMMAHSLSRDAHGRRPVAISRITQPKDHTSTAPARPEFSPLITSGDMYIGVPVIDFWPAGFPGTDGATVFATKVLPWRAMTLAAPKSTYLITPAWSRRISAMEVSHEKDGENMRHTVWLNVTMYNTTLVQIR